MKSFDRTNKNEVFKSNMRSLIGKMLDDASYLDL